MLSHHLTTHPGFKHSFPFGRLSPFFVDMPALADALCEADHDTDMASRDVGRHRQRALLLDVKETEEGVEVTADLPGVQKDHINVDLDKHVLTLRVDHEEKTQESHSEDKKDGDGTTTWHRTERSRVFVKRSIQLPEAADISAGKASYTDGVLSIHFPKKALENAPTKLPIT